MLEKAVSKAATSKEARRTLRYVETLREMRMKPGERRVSARRGRAGEKSEFFSILLELDEQQAGLANFFPGGRIEEGLKVLCRPWKCRFRFPE